MGSDSSVTFLTLSVPPTYEQGTLGCRADGGERGQGRSGGRLEVVVDLGQGQWGGRAGRKRLQIQK